MNFALALRDLVPTLGPEFELVLGAMLLPCLMSASPSFRVRA
jgi:hypothetical protein